MFLSYIEDYANNSAIMKITDRMQKDVSTSVVLRFSLLCDIFVVVYAVSFPLPSNRHHRSNGDSLEGNGGNYQVCSVQYCVQQLCTVQCTHI